MTPPKLVKAKLLKKIELNDESIHFVFEMAEKVDWIPGQFALIGVNDNQEPPLKRPFSIASSPLESPKIGFMIKHHQGRATNWLFDVAKEGEETELMIPMGHMTLQENDKEQLIIGTGIGIAPMFSLIDYLAAKNFPQKTRLVYGARHVKEIFYLEKLEKLSKEHENFELYTTVSRPETEWNGSTGRADSVLKNLSIDFSNQNTYVCGSPPVASSLKDLIITLGVEEESIKMEAF